MDQARFDACQQAYDNQSDPRLEDDDSLERERWEQDLDVTDILDSEDINRLIWDCASEDSFFQRKLQEAWEKHCQTEWENGNRKRAA